MKKYIGLITGLLPLLPLLSVPRAAAQLVMTGGYYMVLSGGSQSNPTSLVLTNPATTGITNAGTGWIISENEFNQVKWNIGTGTGNYVVPFGYGTTDYLPVKCNIATAGTGNGSIKFATYHGATWDNSAYEPTDVTNMTDFGATDYSNNAVDRFWIVDPGNGYSTKPSVDITLTYIRSGASSEIAAPNYIVETDLIAQRFNSSVSQWSDFLGATGMDVTNGNTGSVTSGNVSPSDFYRSWCVMNDSTLLTAGVPGINNPAYNVNVYPNPSNGNFTIAISGANKSIFEVYNVLGQQLFSHPLVLGNNTLNMDSKANGVYLYRIISDKGNLIGEGRLAIQK